ncbi:MAG: DUF5615 family PIN-like protein [Bacteroidales bacterium]|nr:DUF5615 family PIN-like protein [Bacteroidales bacterium]
MAKFIIDANLPYLFKLWQNEEFIHVFDLNDSMTDEEIWDYAKKNELTIISKDADFSNKILYKSSPPRVIHIRTGNLRIQELHAFLNEKWDDIIETSRYHKLTNVYKDRIEGIE